jgi:hypothetical protein
MTTENNTKGKVITKHFPITVSRELAMKMIERLLPENITIECGVNPEKGALSVYSYSDGVSRHSLGRFPTTAYASQWKARAIVTGAALAFIAHDSRQANPQLATKQSTGTEAGDALEFSENDLEELLGV